MADVLVNINGALECLEGSIFTRTAESGEDERFTTHVIKTASAGVHIIFSFEDEREDEAVELDVFLIELIQGAYVQV